MNTAAISGGFSDPGIESAQAFRCLMEAMARPGTIHRVGAVTPPPPLSPAAGVVLLTLCDTDTPLHVAPSHDREDVRSWIRFHTGAPLVAKEQCAFAVGEWEALCPLEPYAKGTPEYPDRSATLVIETTQLIAKGATLEGPGIRTQAHLSLPEVAAFATNGAFFPLGLDFILTCGDRVAALPRTTRVT